MYKENYKLNKFLKPGKFLRMMHKNGRNDYLGFYIESMDFISKEVDSFFGLFQKQLQQYLKENK